MKESNSLFSSQSEVWVIFCNSPDEIKNKEKTQLGIFLSISLKFEKEGFLVLSSLCF